ncbi:MAG TPA: metallophosphoesterase [Gemmatimonadaceae bacterium]|nr:metallophosphoesterase [Gemmatimonadaceae bacterium]
MPEWVEGGGAARPSAPELRVVPTSGERREGGDRRRRSRVRIAAVGDFHVGEEDAGAYRDLFSSANDDADVLVLCGDLTRRGLAVEFKTVVAELADVKIPIVVVLGNHDYESGQGAEGTTILRGRGAHVLAGDAFQLNEHVGFAGVKGFMGGFGRGTLTAFGEPETKAFVAAALEEVQRFELALRRLATPVRVAVLHYSPVAGTVAGEPEMIFPFLGTDRLAEPIDRYGCAIAFHGHAHQGTFRGQTPGGVPVYNVSLPLLRKDGVGKLFYVHEIAIPTPSASTG